jgi:MoxR-like ATPase/Mg-chelatase subunit ChlD
MPSGELGADPRRHVAGSAPSGAGGGEIVGRAAEIEMAMSALRTARHLLIEGPHGSGKSELVAEMCRRAGRRRATVTGSLSLTASALVGHHDPAVLLRRGYTGESFVPGALTISMRNGAVLHVDEANRLLPDAFSVLISAMSEGAIEVPRHGRVRAAPGFVVIAAANPLDRVGTGDLPQAFTDRVVRLSLDHQSASDERAIVRVHCPGAPGHLVERAVAITRATRYHRDLRRGASVRAAMDMVAVARQLSRMLQDSAAGSGSGAGPGSGAGSGSGAGLRSALLALSSKIEVRPGSARTPEAIIRELWIDLELLAHRSTGPVRAEAALSSLAAPRLDQPAEAPADAPQVAASPGGGARAAEAAGGAHGGAATGSAGAQASLASLSGPPAESAPARETRQALADFVRQARRGERGAHVARPRTLPAAELGLGEIERLAARIVVRRARERLAGGPARTGRISSVRYNFRSDDIDIDRTVESLVEHPVPVPSDIWVHDRVPRRRSVVLLLDVSGSMRGRRLLEAATAAAAASVALEHDELAVVAFAGDVTVLRQGDQPLATGELARRVMRLRPIGLTDIQAGLIAAVGQLGRMRSANRVGVIMTDGVHNLGADPRGVAGRFGRLNVLATTSSPWRLELCRQLAAAGSGTCETYRSLDDLPVALSRLLA